MKKFYSLTIALCAALSFAACGSPAAEKTYSLEGGAKITLNQENFGELREIKINQKQLNQYKSENPETKIVKTAFYDNFSSYPKVVFSYAYTQTEQNSAEQAPFGFEDVVYDNIEEINIDEVPCRKSSFVETETEKKVFSVSCKKANESWDFFFQTYHASADLDEAEQAQEAQALETINKMNQENAAIAEAAIKTISFK